MRVGGIVAAQRAQKRKDVVVHNRKHFLRFKILEPRPAQIIVGAALRVMACGKDAALHRFLEPGGFVFLQRVQIVEPLKEQQVGDLLDDFERIGNAARPEGIPEGINLVANVSSNHGRLAIAGIVISERLDGKKGVALGESP
jgi:hypothetical protein